MSHFNNTVPRVDAIVRRAEEFARREPAKAIVSAFGAGVVLNILPMRAVASTCTRLAFSLARPALLFLGLRKAYDLWTTQSHTSARHEQ